MEEFVKGVIESSFPVAVAAYLLLRLERKLDCLTAVIRQLQHCQTCTLSPRKSPTQDAQPSAEILPSTLAVPPYPI